MSITSTINIVKAIIDLLNNVNKPISEDEIAFRIRTPQSLVNESLTKLKRANVVLESQHLFELNPKRQEYNLKSLIS